jgi:hypothetical protein
MRAGALTVCTALAWLVSAGVIAADGYLLLTACGVVVAPERSWVARFVPPACTAQVRPDRLLEQRARYAALERRVRDIELDIARAQGACAPPLEPARPIVWDRRP